MERRPQQSAVELRVGGQTYRVNASATEATLLRLADVVDDKLRAYGGARAGTPQALLLAAMALANDLEEERARRIAAEERTKAMLRTVTQRLDALISDAEAPETLSAPRATSAAPLSASQNVAQRVSAAPLSAPQHAPQVTHAAPLSEPSAAQVLGAPHMASAAPASPEANAALVEVGRRDASGERLDAERANGLGGSTGSTGSTGSDDGSQ